MNITVIRNEPERGCGFRKEGGKYLVGFGDLAPCGKLPKRLDVCSCCGQGFKFSRTPIWVDPKAMFHGRKCEYAEDADGDCRGPEGNGCVLSDSNLAGMERREERMLMMWIGEKFYKTPADFTREASSQGISRRINFIPRGFEIGKTWVLFAHNRTVECEICFGDGVTGDKVDDPKCSFCGGHGRLPGLFLVHRPTRIDYIVTGKETEEEIERLEIQGCTLVKLERDPIEIEWAIPKGEIDAHQD